jgi:hypothetical protein
VRVQRVDDVLSVWVSADESLAVTAEVTASDEDYSTSA